MFSGYCFTTALILKRFSNHCSYTNDTCWTVLIRLLYGAFSKIRLKSKFNTIDRYYSQAQYFVRHGLNSFDSKRPSRRNQMSRTMNCLSCPLIPVNFLDIGQKWRIETDFMVIFEDGTSVNRIITRLYRFRTIISNEHIVR